VRENELKHFETILKDRKTQILKNITSVKNEIEQLHGLELNDEGDHASVSNENLVDNAIGSQQQLELMEIETALAKINNGQYGICEMCEEEIGFQRLKVKPHAKYCIDCREIAEKNNS